MVFDENDPKYHVACCCRAPVRVASAGCVYLTLLLSVIVFIQAVARLATSNTNDHKLVALLLLIVSLLTIGAIFVWALAVRTGRWPLMMVLHSALATWATICLGGTVLFAFALANGSITFMQKIIRLAFGTGDYWSTWTPTSTCWLLCISFALFTIFFSWALFVMLTYYGYVIAKEDAKKIPSWKIGRTSISLHTVAQFPDEHVKDIPFIFAKMPLH